MNQIVDFVLAKAGWMFKDWPRSTVESWVCFHVENGSLSVATEGNDVVAVMAGWRQATDKLEPFEWQKPDPNGGWFFWSLFAAESHQAALRVARHFLTKHPEAVILPAVAGRNGKHGCFRRLRSMSVYLKAERIYGNRRSSTDTTGLLAGDSGHFAGAD